jgi:hypothetical protein
VGAQDLSYLLLVDCNFVIGKPILEINVFGIMLLSRPMGSRDTKLIMVDEMIMDQFLFSLMSSANNFQIHFSDGRI